MKKFVAMLLALVMTLSLAACGQKNDTKDDANSDTKELTYAVEAGSAGEAAAAEKGFKTVSVDTQAKALMEADAGTADAAIIDLLMAGAMVGENTSYPNLKVTDQKLTSELYGIGCRKGSDLASFINSVLAETYASGKMQEVATTYGVQESLVEQSPCEYTASESDSDVQYIKDKGKLIVGITEFEPMDYQDANGQWIGFDADMAKLVAEKLGVAVEFQIINWDMKVEELDGKQIDCVWNGMTLTDGVTSAMACTNAYCKNAQVVVVKDGTEYTSTADLVGKTVVAEAGSAGESAIAEDASLSQADYISKSVQTDCLMEVAAGTADAAVLDLTLANAMIGEGTDYSSLKIVDELNAEEYGVAFRKGSDAAAAVDEAFDALKADGTLSALAEKYELTLAD